MWKKWRSWQNARYKFNFSVTEISFWHMCLPSSFSFCLLLEGQWEGETIIAFSLLISVLGGRVLICFTVKLMTCASCMCVSSMFDVPDGSLVLKHCQFLKLNCYSVVNVCQKLHFQFSKTRCWCGHCSKGLVVCGMWGSHSSEYYDYSLGCVATCCGG